MMKRSVLVLVGLMPFCVAQQVAAPVAHYGSHPITATYSGDLQNAPSTGSMFEGVGMQQLWGAIVTRWTALASSGELARLRTAQARQWMWDEVAQGLRDHAQHATGDRGRELAQQVADGRLLPHLAAAQILADLLDGTG